MSLARQPRHDDVGGADFDPSVPATILKIGRYPLSQGNIGAVHTLSRAGVEVFQVVESPFAPAARSRLGAGLVIWPTSGTEPIDQLVEGVATIGRLLGEPSVLICTDDEAAVLVAEHRAELAESFLLPAVPAGLPRQLAAKRELGPICEALGVVSPKVTVPATPEELAAFVEETELPVIVKHAAAWSRLHVMTRSNTVVSTRDELRTLTAGWTPPYEIVFQDYIPPEHAEDWFCHTYQGVDAAASVVFTGAKIHQYPASGGLSAYSEAAENPELVAICTSLFERLGYRGIAGLDWRYDRRDGRYKLLDFNPRITAQFRLHESESGIDVVRAAHLDLTGRPIPQSPQRYGETLLVEHLYPPARLRPHGRAQVPPTVAHPRRRGTRRFGWWAADDPVPSMVLPFWVGLELANKRLVHRMPGSTKANRLTTPVLRRRTGRSERGRGAGATSPERS